jgi:hypothetical protein
MGEKLLSMRSLFEDGQTSSDMVVCILEKVSCGGVIRVGNVGAFPIDVTYLRAELLCGNRGLKTTVKHTKTLEISACRCTSRTNTCPETRSRRLLVLLQMLRVH